MISDAAGVCLIILRILSGPAPGASQESLYSTQGQGKAMIVVFYNLTPGSGMRHLTCSGSESLKTSIPRIRVSCRVSGRPGLGLQCHNQPIKALELSILTNERARGVKECLA